MQRLEEKQRLETLKKEVHKIFMKAAEETDGKLWEESKRTYLQCLSVFQSIPFDECTNVEHEIYVFSYMNSGWAYFHTGHPKDCYGFITKAITHANCGRLFKEFPTDYIFENISNLIDSLITSIYHSDNNPKSLVGLRQDIEALMSYKTQYKYLKINFIKAVIYLSWLAIQDNNLHAGLNFFRIAITNTAELFASKSARVESLEALNQMHFMYETLKAQIVSKEIPEDFQRRFTEDEKNITNILNLFPTEVSDVLARGTARLELEFEAIHLGNDKKVNYKSQM